MKVDPKVRFQQGKFKQQLQTARTYKRTPKIVPVKPMELFFSRLGIHSILSIVLAILCVAGLLYLIVIPNVFTIKSVTINGLPPEQTVSAEQNALRFIQAKPHNFQKNNIFFSKNKLINDSTNIDPNIISVQSVKKIFPNKIELTVTPRHVQYFVQTPQGYFSLSNDARVEEQFSQALSTTTIFRMDGFLKIKTDEPTIPNIHDHYSTITTLNFINDIKNNLSQQTKKDFDYAQLHSASSTDVTVFTKDGVKFIFDTTMNAADTINRLKLILTNFDDNQLKTLYYIDMRFQNRGYVCLKNTPCVKEASIAGDASSTPTTLPIQPSTN